MTEIAPLLGRAGLFLESGFYNESTRQLRFTTNCADIDVIQVRSFDVATFVAFGAAELGIAGSDVLAEFDFSELYAPLDLGVGHCHLAVAAPAIGDDHAALNRSSHIRVATKYPEITRRHFAAQGVQAECIKLNGALELAPSLGLSQRIVDLVSTGATLRANGLVEIATIMQVSARLIVNRTAMKTRSDEMMGWIDRFQKAVRDAVA